MAGRTLAADKPWNYAAEDCTEQHPRCIFAEETHCRLTEAQMRGALSRSFDADFYPREDDTIVLKRDGIVGYYHSNE